MAMHLTRSDVMCGAGNGTDGGMLWNGSDDDDSDTDW